MIDNKLEIVLAAKDITGKAFTRVQGEVASLSKSFVSLNTAVAGVAGASGLGLLVNQSINATAEIERLAKMAGVQVEAFQELEYAAGKYQITQDALTDGLKELSLRGDEFVKTGVGPAEDAFRRLGYSQEEVNAKLADTPALLQDVISRMEGLGKAAQLRIADELFGGQGGEQFVAMIQGGAKALGDLRRAARELGVVIDAGLVKQSVEAKKEIKALTSLLSAQFNSAVAELAPDIADVAGDMADWVKANKAFLSQDVPSHIKDIAGSVKDFTQSSSFKTLVANWEILAGARIGAFAGPKGMVVGALAGKAFQAYGDYQDDKKSNPDNQSGSKDVLDKLHQKLGRLEDLYNRTGSPQTFAEMEKIRKQIDHVGRSNRNDFDWRAARDGFLSGSNPSDSNGGGGSTTGNATAVSVPSWDTWMGDVADLHAAEDERAADLKDSIDLQNRLAQAAEDTYDVDYGQATDGMYDMADAMTDLEDKAVETANVMEDAFSGWATGYSATLNDMLWESEFSFDAIATSFGKMITQMMIQQEMASAASWASGAVGSVFSSLFHDGGVVGSGDGSAKAVNPSVFAGAPRLHSGLMPDEFPAILQRGEGVFTPQQMEALGSSRGQAPIVNIEIKNNGSQEIAATQAPAKFDGEKWVIGVVLDAMRRNHGFRNNIKEVSRG